ncbi:MAG: hypothetical protein VW338_06755 [Rhodospirillaceae bacterium]
MKTITSRTALAVVAAVIAIGSLGGCVPATTGGMEGIGFRQARFEEISAIREYRSCVDDAIKLSERARTSGQAGGYLASAKLLERCESNLGPEANSLAREERMRNYGLGIVSYIKAGDIQKAQVNLETFKKSFDGHDLYLPNGASFIDTVTLLTVKRDAASPQEMAMMNVSSTLRAEIQRARFWKNN